MEIFGPLEITEQGAPATPAAGRVKIYADGGRVFYKTSDGTEVELESARRNGTTVGVGSVVAGDIVLDVDTPWGIDGLGDYYYDEDGAAPGEEAILHVDGSGAMFLVPLADLHAGPSLADRIALLETFDFVAMEDGIADLETADTALDTRLDALEAPVPVGTGLATTGAINLDMAALDGTYQTIALTGNPTFTTSNRSAGCTVTVKLIAGGSARTITWPAWIPLTAALPTNLASGKVAVFTVTFWDGTDAAATAAYAAQP